MKGDDTARRVTIRDVSRVAGVSLTTVSHALNDRGAVDPVTRAMVKQVAEKLGYTPNVRAQRLRSGQSNSIAIVSAMPFAVSGGQSRLGFMMEIAAIAAEEAMKQGLALVFVPPLEIAANLLQRLDIDGAIVIEPLADDPSIRLLQDRGVALVSIGSQSGPDSVIPYVDLHSEATATLLLEHLYARGCRRIALLQGTAARSSYRSNAQAYKKFIDVHGLEHRYAEADEEDGEEGGRKACQELFMRYPDTDAICVPVDAFATGVMRQAAAMGKHIPHNLMVATRYDGLRARTATPPLTAINLHLTDIASLAVELLFEHISGNRHRSCVAGPMPELVARLSTGSFV
ncbi:substrate-binding domain-containing protein [Paenalcaligenes niemegkensis]|uniref:substrate-binding domain-containing protein n=1 Tax=Paenalcaligenes niemegkensis TaxID=2895469 RepID=UPI001EE7CDA8|nr:substrate-binding domain-containing protein [Paenalcaligenes niemegkensis]MCQ9618010.1 substrate-binding domain-containing protein [Paenalcaligenes niemegkensis]